MTQPTRPMLAGTFGMAASTHWLASATAMSVLERGGNAFDAAAAGGFVLQVVEPHLNGPGGEVPILAWSGAEQRVHVVCGQGVAPAAATIDELRGRGLGLVPGTGLLPATVPGAFGGWLLMLERWGSWRLRDVLGYAIHYARHGFPVLPGTARTIATVAQLFETHWPTSAAAWLPDGVAPAPRARLTNPVLAATYERVVRLSEHPSGDRVAELRTAREVWYGGFVAESLDRFCATTRWRDTSGTDNGGLLTLADLAEWQPVVEESVSYDYGRYTVHKTRPWGQGPVFLQQLALLSGFDLDGVEFLGPDYLHTVTECAKLAFADREAWYGDSPLVDDLPAALLSEDYNRSRRELVGADADLTLRPGAVGGREPVLPPVTVGEDEPEAGAGAGEPTIDRDGVTRGDTCHIDVADRHGNLVSATPSGGWLQSSPYIPELGFCLGTRGQMFWLEPGLPNSLRPLARPRTTLSPTIAMRDGSPWLAFGTPGGDQQDQWSLVFFLAVAHGGLDVQQAIESPMFHIEHMPSSFYPRHAYPGRLLVEERVGAATLEELSRRGHDLRRSDPWSLGRLASVGRDGEQLVAGADPRGSQAYAAGR